VQHGDRLQRQLIANGQVLGRYGTGPDPVKPKDDDANPQFTTGADLNFTYQLVNDTHPGTTPTAYRVQPGDTLQGIAKQAYGDAGYWYRIAEANGLEAKTALQTGQHLQLPGLPGTTFDRAESMRPYDASLVVGDTTPTMPPPPPDDGGCGILGMIFVIIVAVVATVLTAGAAAAALGATATAAGGTSLAALGTAALTGGTLAGVGGVAGFAAAVAGGIAGSILSQGFAIAIGVQDHFSWSGVALSALSAGVSAGVGGAATGFIAGEGALAVASRAVVSNAITQGIGVATGLQDQFSWTNVAAAGIGAGVGNVVGQGLQNTAFQNAFGKYGVAAVSGFAGGAAAAMARGGRISVTQVATDAFGQAIGSSIAEHDWSGPAGNGEGQTFAEDMAARRAANPLLNWQGSSGMGADSRLDAYLPLDDVWAGTDAPDYGPPSGDGGSGPRQVRAGDYRGSLERVARAELGSNATQREINNYVGQLFEVNGISNARTIQPNQMITLPDETTPYATQGLSLYGEDITYGEQLRADLAAAQRQTANTLIDSVDSMRIGPTIQRAQAMGLMSVQDGVVAGGGVNGYAVSNTESTWQGNFMRGYRGDYRSVMEGPAPTSETIGRYSGEVVDSFKNFGMSMSGARSMNAAQVSWNAGNYGTSLVQGATAFGEAGMTVFGFGLGSTARYGATMTAAELAAVRGTYADSAANLSAYKIRFSQNSVSFNKIDRATGQPYTYDDLVSSMRTNGWKGDPVDLVRMPDGILTSMDNTRITAAREAGIGVQGTLRGYGEVLTPAMQNARGWSSYSTWGEAITARISNQSKGFSTANPYGSLQSPRIKGQP
jgi:LysM repeat protein